jgi:hypothetical protein
MKISGEVIGGIRLHRVYRAGDSSPRERVRGIWRGCCDALVCGLVPIVLSRRARACFCFVVTPPPPPPPPPPATPPLPPHPTPSHPPAAES